MPWVHLHISQNGNVIPCCQAPPHKVHRFGNINEQSISEIWESEAMETFRLKMLNNEKDHRCKQCYIKEEQGFKSLREITNEKYSKETAEVIELGKLLDDKPLFFDIRFSNACNLKCRICGPWASSQWYKDAVALGMRSTDKKALSVAINNENEFFKELLPILPEAKEFYFAGGEPLMMEQHYKVLDALIDCGNTNIKLAYNTNFSTLNFKDKSAVHYWKHFKNIELTASLDAEAEKGEYLRKNLNWNKVLQNRQVLFKELPHIQFQLAPTVCIFNVAHLPEFHKSWVNQKLISVEDFQPNILINPKEYQINVLPTEKQTNLKPAYAIHLEWIKQQPYKNLEKRDLCIAQFESILSQLGNQANNKIVDSFKIKTEQLDLLRKENVDLTFPDL